MGTQVGVATERLLALFGNRALDAIEWGISDLEKLGGMWVTSQGDL